jgi:DNA polymerase
MRELFWDIESRSAASLRLQGPWRYAGHVTTAPWFICYAVDDGDVGVWLPSQPPPAPFLAAASDPLNWRTIAHNAEFERAMLERVLVPRYGFALIPIEIQHCSMSLALANGYPAELDRLAKALGLEYQKDREGARLMRKMAGPRKPRRGEDKAILHWVDDTESLQQLIGYGRQDVRTSRAAWRHPKLKALSETEQRIIRILDAVINRRGIRGDRSLAVAARDMAIQERARLNTAMAELTAGTIKSIDQIERIRMLVNAHGHDMQSLGRRSVSAVLAGQPCEEVRQILELRRDGARASTRKYERILAYIDDHDDRLRGTMRLHGSATGRWSGRGPQLQNLKKNESGIPLAAIEAVRNGDREQLHMFGNPLTVLGDIARAIICAGPGNILVAADFSAIESRILAWLSGEQWKIQLYADYDATGDKGLEPYRVLAAKMLHKTNPATITQEERNKGKAGELACGFGGSLGAWRRIASEDKRSDAEILADIHAWRTAHPKTTAFWHALTRAIRIAMRTGQPFSAGKIVAEFSDGNLTLTLPSGRKITYPEARLVPSKFEAGPPDVLFKDNARGKWTDYRGWFGTFAENVVQGTARDLLAAALERFEARGIPVVLHVHDEIVAEVPAGSIQEAEFLAILLEPPAWAVGLPLAGSVWSGTHYFEPPEESTAPPISPTEDTVEKIICSTAIEAETDDTPEDTVELAKADDEDFVAELEDTVAPLFDLVTVPLTADNKTTCPFHEGDDTPSLQFYAEHFHCFGCGEHGDRLDWLIRGEEMTRDESIATIKDWDGQARRPVEDKADKLERAIALWEEAGPIQGTLAEQYLAQTRKIELAVLPADLERVLRFHPNCPFAPGLRHPCLLALMRNPTTDVPTGIQRIALTNTAKKIDRRMLGLAGAVKIWPAGLQLVVGEGLETVLAAATCITYRGAPLQPAWSALSTGLLERFPVLPGVERLIILVDHDFAGKAAAASCAERWQRAGRTAVRLTPKRAGADFNDLVMPEPVS